MTANGKERFKKLEPRIGLGSFFPGEEWANRPLFSLDQFRHLRNPQRCRLPLPMGGNPKFERRKEAAGAHFAIDPALNGTTQARTVMNHVDSTAASVTAANAFTDSYHVPIVGIAT